jgi:THO complex subunit 2
VSPARAQVIAQFTQRMIVPRAKISPMDAFFCARFVRLMHDLGTPNFASLSFYDKLFGDQLIPTVFHMSDDEIRNYARFLADILSTLSAWYKSEELYLSQALGIDKLNGPKLVGFVQKASALQNPAAITKGDYLQHSSYRIAYAKWQKNTCVALRTCIESREYMMIRNGLLLLIPLAEYFPYDARVGQTLLTVVKTLSLRENEEGGREDLKILAKGYEAILSKRSRTWDVPPAPPAPAQPSAPKLVEQAPGDIKPPVEIKPEEPAVKEPEKKPEPAATSIVAQEEGEATAPTSPVKEEDTPMTSSVPLQPGETLLYESQPLPSVAAARGLASLPLRPGQPPLAPTRSASGAEPRPPASNGSNTPVSDRQTPRSDRSERPDRPERISRPVIPLPARPSDQARPLSDVRPPPDAPSGPNTSRSTGDDRVPTPTKSASGHSGLPSRPPSDLPRHEPTRKDSSREDERDRTEPDKDRDRRDRDRRGERDSGRDRDSKDGRSGRRHREGDLKRDGSRHGSPESVHSDRRRERGDDKRDRRDKDGHRSSRHRDSARDKDRHGGRSSRHESSKESARDAPRVEEPSRSTHDGEGSGRSRRPEDDGPHDVRVISSDG